MLYEEITASTFVTIDVEDATLLQPDHGYNVNVAGFYLCANLASARQASTFSISAITGGPPDFRASYRAERGRGTSCEFWRYAVAMHAAATSISPPALPSTILRRVSLRPFLEPTELTMKAIVV
jgi:hypothetical protein